MLINPLVSIIIVNFNGKHLLKKCLESVKKNKYKKIEIIVVDNGSTDGSDKLLKKIKLKQKLILIQNKKNLGFAKANNQGLEASKGELILLLNNDAFIMPDTIEILVKTFSLNKKIGVVQPKIIFNKTKKLQSGGDFSTFLGFLYHFGYNQNPNKQQYNMKFFIFSANGACMMIRKKVVDKIGLFDPDFFAYYEETDFCHRVWLSGHEVVYEPRATAYHLGAQTSSKIGKNFLYFHSFKNNINSKIKNYELRQILKILPILLVLNIVLILKNLISIKPIVSIAIANAIFWNISHLFNTMTKRKKIQEIRKVRDGDYLKKVKVSVDLSYYFNSLLNREVLLKNENFPSASIFKS